MRRAVFFLLFLAFGIAGSMIVSSYTAEGRDASFYFLKKKKDKKKKKKKKKKKVPKSNCDAGNLSRTSADTTILKKYVALYKDLGGVCYIKKLQDMGDLVKTGDGQYTVYLGKSKTPDDRMAWTTYMYCPIGKPDGIVALVQSTGDTVQFATYKNEMKNGRMVWLKPRYGVVAVFDFINDEKPVTETQEYDPNATTPTDSEPEQPRNRTEETGDSLFSPRNRTEK